MSMRSAWHGASQDTGTASACLPLAPAAEYAKLRHETCLSLESLLVKAQSPRQRKASRKTDERRWPGSGRSMWNWRRSRRSG